MEKKETNPMKDFAFKSVINHPKFRASLEEFIMLCTGLEEEEVKDKISIKNSELLVGTVESKRNIADIVMDIGTNKVLNIEANQYYYPGLVKRNYLYSCKCIIMKDSEDVIGYQINFDCFPKPLFPKREVKKHFFLKEEVTNEKGYNLIEIIHFDLYYLKKEYYTGNKTELTKLERYLLIFMLKKSEEREKIAEGDEGLINMNELINLICGSKEQALLYYDPEEEERLIIKSYRDEARREGLRKGEELGLKKGEELGLKKGEELGLRKGEELGLKKGEELGLRKGEELGLRKGEERSKIEMAKAMKSKGLSPQIIMEITGLNERTIAK